MLKFKEVWTLKAVADFGDRAYISDYLDPEDEHVIAEYYTEDEALAAYTAVTDIASLDLPFDNALVETIEIVIVYCVRPVETPDYGKTTWFNVGNFKHQLEISLNYVADRFKGLDLTEDSVKATNYRRNLESINALEKLDPKSYVRLKDIQREKLSMDAIQEDLKERQKFHNL